MKSTMMLLAAALLVLAACEEKKAETKPEDPAKTGATATAVAPVATDTPVNVAPSTVAIADTDLSTPADFEESAEKAISKANYKTELASLESDIAKQ